MNTIIDTTMYPIVQVATWSLKTAEPFNNLFPINPTVLSDITDDMSENGFDVAHPIIVWNMTVVDGHARLRAANAIGLESVPVVFHEFKDEEEALEYAIYSQQSRRNLTEWELLQCIAKLDIYRCKRGGSPQQKLCKGKSSAITAEKLGISRASVERLRAINDYGTDEIKDFMRRGEYSIHRAYEETMRLRRPKVDSEPDTDAELIHLVMSDIHSKLNWTQIRKLVKALKTELETY